MAGEIPNDNILQNLKNSLLSTALAVGEAVVPVLTTSKFADKGVLTPQEFVEAGDFLVSKCPAWQWSAGDADKRRPYLPEKKQFLVTRGVPSRCRVRALERDVEGDDTDVGEGWLATSNAHVSSTAGDYEDVDAAAKGLSALGVSSPPAAAKAPPLAAPPQDEEDEDYIDLDSFEDAALASGDASTATASASTSAATTKSAAPAPAAAAAAAATSSILRTRTYDLSITYDKYYQVPRMWLFGYDETGRPLAPSAVFEDISSDHANKTATIEPHPHMALQCASVHPCRHASVMKKLFDGMGTDKATGAPRVDLAIMVFLKFMQSIIPTIEFDLNAFL